MDKLLRLAAILSMAAAIPVISLAAEPPATSRIQVTVTHLKPGMTDEWTKAYKDTVVPALKKAGVPWFSVSEQIFGDRFVYTSVRPLDKFSELDGPGVLEQAGLTQKQRDAFNVIADSCILSQERFIANIQNEFNVAARGPAVVRVLNVLRANPGQGEALRALIRTDVLPAMRQAQQAGKLAALGLATTAQGNPGLTVIWVDYPNFATLDAGNTLSQAMGAPAFALFQARLAQLAVVEDTVVQRLVADLSYSPPN